MALSNEEMERERSLASASGVNILKCVSVLCIQIKNWV